MTLDKAVEMLQNLRNCELGSIDIIGNDHSVTKTMQLICKGKADYLEKILHEIEPQTYPCNHPEKSRDCCGGQWYCMDCNLDLDPNYDNFRNS